MLTLYQAEWCPFSAAVRERLTELGLDFVARQVPPWPEQRVELAAKTGTDEIPVLVAEDGEHHAGTRAIFGFLAGFEVASFAAGHRERYLEHAPAREGDVAGQLLQRAAPL